MIIANRKTSLENSDFFSLLEFLDDFEYLSQWLQLILTASALSPWLQFQEKYT